MVKKNRELPFIFCHRVVPKEKKIKDGRPRLPQKKSNTRRETEEINCISTCSFVPPHPGVHAKTVKKRDETVSLPYSSRKLKASSPMLPPASNSFLCVSFINTKSQQVKRDVNSSVQKQVLDGVWKAKTSPGKRGGGIKVQHRGGYTCQNNEMRATGHSRESTIRARHCLYMH